MSKILGKKVSFKAFTASVFSFAILLSTPPLRAAESPWKGSEMTLDFYKQFVAEENCGEASRDYLACVYSVRTLLKSIDPNLDLETQTTAPESQARVVMNANNLVIVKHDAKSLAAQKLEKTNLSIQDIFLKTEKFKSSFINKFNPAYYHYRKTSQFVITELIRFIETNYKNKLSEEQIANALNEYFHVASDPHSDFRLKKELAKDAQSASSDFVGIGVGINQTQESLLIQNVFEGSGAEAAGLEPGDIITSVGTKKVTGDNLEEVMNGLRGIEGTQVQVQIQRDKQSMNLTITRRRIVIKVVAAKIIENGGEKIGYIGYSNFVYENGCQEIEKSLVDFNQQGVRGAILDLRSNGGGRVDIANCIGGLFLGPGKIVAHLEENSPTGKRIETIITNRAQVFSLPLVVLTDAHSASASELLAGALRDYNRAYIVGQTSFGKGSSQSPVSETADMLFYATNGLFYQPSGHTNQTIGIKPHVEAFKGLSPSPSEQYAMREKDMFMFPLQPKQLAVNYDTSGFDKLMAPLNCISAKRPQDTFTQLPKKSFQKDLQILTGAALISCL